MLYTQVLGQKQNRTDMKFWLLFHAKMLEFFFFSLDQDYYSQNCVLGFAPKFYIFNLMTMFCGFNADCWFWTAECDCLKQTEGLDVCLKSVSQSQNSLCRNDLFGVTDVKVVLLLLLYVLSEGHILCFSA